MKGFDYLYGYAESERIAKCVRTQKNRDCSAKLGRILKDEASTEHISEIEVFDALFATRGPYDESVEIRRALKERGLLDSSMPGEA